MHTQWTRWAAIVCVFACGAVPIARADWRAFDQDDGLPGAQVHTVLPTQGAWLWFGCDNGAVRTDGVRWEHALDNLFVNAAVESSDGTIWFATAGDGIWAQRGTSFEQFTRAGTQGALPSDAITTATFDGGGNVWFGTYDAGAVRYDGRQWFRLRAPNLASDSVYAVVPDPAGNFWFGTARGLTRWGSDGSFTTFGTAEGLPSRTVNAIALDADGTVWVGTAAGIARNAGATFATVRGGVEVLAIAREGNRAWWFGTTSGVLRWDGREWLQFDTSDGLPGPQVLTLAFDGAGNVWAGTNGGAARFDGGRIGWYAADPASPGDPWTQVPLPSNDLTSVAATRDGRIWMGTDAGVVRFDATGWTTRTVVHGLPSPLVRDVVEDAASRVWVATAAGVARVESAGGFTVYRVADGLPSDDVRALAPAADGTLWAATGAGVARFASGAWQPVTVPLPSPDVRDVTVDAGGTLWIATWSGAVRCTDAACTTFRMADGLVRDEVRTVFVDAQSRVWFGTPGGTSVLDGGAWRSFTAASSGLAHNDVYGIAADAQGGTWFATASGLSRVQDETTWQTLRNQDGLVSLALRAVVLDDRGHAWLASSGGLGTVEPDAAAPTTVFVATPPALSSSRSQRIDFQAGFGDLAGVEFSVSENDGQTWSPWFAREYSWSAAGLADGIYRWRVRARDAFGNLDDHAPVAAFEIDATPPAPVVTAPGFGAVVRGVVSVRGTTADARFARAAVDARSAGGSAWTPLADLTTPGVDVTLADWDTRPLADGLYEIRVAVVDVLGLATQVRVGVHVDNVAPFADRTTPVRIRAATGGEAFTLDGAVRCYFAPQAFDADAIVSLVAADTAAVPIPDVQPLAVCDIAVAGATLRAPGTIAFRLPDPASDVAVWRFDAGWARVGGRVTGGEIVAPFAAPGRWALVSGGGSGAAAASLSAVRLTPAVFSPTGAFAADRVAIGFAIGRAGPVSVRLYNRAGRLVREVTRSESMAAGENIVYWDGRDDDGRRVVPGPYIVHVGAPGGEQVATVVVTR